MFIPHLFNKSCFAPGIGKSLDIDSMEATTEGHSSCANSCKSAILEASKIWTEDAITTEPSTTENLR